MAEKRIPKKRLTVTMAREVFDHLRRRSYETEKPYNALIELALRMYLPVPRKQENQANG
jgi:hypothetical protein